MTSIFRGLILGPLFLFLIQGCSSFSSCPDEVVAAFDIGSGTTKVQVARRNSCDLTIKKTLLKTSKPVAYAQDLNTRESFSKEIVKRGERAIRELMEKALNYNPKKIFGVATQAFRQAQNGKEVLESWKQKYGWPFQVIDQQKEAMLAYELVKLKLGYSDEDDLTVWDIGGGSQQMVTKNKDRELKIFKSKLAAVTFKNKVIKTIKKNKAAETPNPMDQQEIEKALEIARQAIRSDLIRGPLVEDNKASKEVIGIGGVHGACVKNQLNLKDNERVYRSSLDEAISKRVGFSDEDLGGDYASTDLTNLILVKALMLEYGIDNYLPLSTNLTESLLRQVP